VELGRAARAQGIEKEMKSAARESATLKDTNEALHNRVIISAYLKLSNRNVPK
jgi:hypothetical protein